MNEHNKLCPFLNKECIEAECTLYIDVMQHNNILGMMKTSKVGVCVFPALAMIMSSKPQVPVKLPQSFLKGN